MRGRRAIKLLIHAPRMPLCTPCAMHPMPLCICAPMRHAPHAPIYLCSHALMHPCRVVEEVILNSGGSIGYWQVR